MKIEVKKVVEANAKCLHVAALVRYTEDACIDGNDDEAGNMPCLIGDMWKPVIDIDSGVIINWEQGKTADIHYKVCDCGTYTVTDDNGDKIIERDGYVPDIMSPGGQGYGDYIIMKIDEDGKIENWKADLDDIIEVEDE